MKARLSREEAENQSLRVQLALLGEEFEAYKKASQKADPASDPAQAESAPPAGPVKFAARVGEDRKFFSGRLVLTVADVNNLDQEAAVRLHYVDSAYRETNLVKVGEPLTVKMGDRESQYFLDQLKGSVAFFSFYESLPAKSQKGAGPKPDLEPEPKPDLEPKPDPDPDPEPKARSRSRAHGGG
ncbi:MAG: hypothetical protein LBE01_00170 [Deltaproteobacteria bacterium]|nr:hypothetical protein [Deltaproteobacteria bacterium]